MGESVPNDVILVRLDDIVRRLDKIDADHDDYVLQQTYDVQTKAYDREFAQVRASLQGLGEAITTETNTRINQREADATARKSQNFAILVLVIGNLVTIVLGVIGFVIMLSSRG